MAQKKLLLAGLLTSGLITMSTLSIAQDGVSCGESPAAPELVDGSTASMEELVANSRAVNAFIEQADTYLDCQKAAVENTTNGLSRDERAIRTAQYESLVPVRNEIGDLFNAEVQEYRAANPE